MTARDPSWVPPSAPVGVLGELDDEGLSRESYAERWFRRRRVLHAVIAWSLGGALGFPVLLVVAKVVGWHTRHIPGLAGAVAWACGAAVLYAVLRWGDPPAT